MRYTDLIFDLYGTLVDIHTQEDDPVWEKTALFFGYYGASYTGAQLRQAFCQQMEERQVQAGQSYALFPEIPAEQVMAELFRAKGIRRDADVLGVSAAQLFRIASTDYIRLYPHITQVLSALRARGYRLWLLSNAQAVFTRYELRHLGLSNAFDGIYLSSEHGCRKPDSRFFQALLDEQNLKREQCLMIGNDRDTDIAGAKNIGMDTIYMHTNLTPQEQTKADPRLLPGTPGLQHFEFEGSNWQALLALLIQMEADTL